MLPLIVGGGALQDHDADRLVHLLAAAGGLARVGTDAPADRRQRHVLPDHVERLVEPVLLDRLDVGRDVDMGRALVLAGSGVLVDEAEFVGVALLAAVDVGQEIVAEMLHRIEHRHRGTRAEGALAVFQQFGEIGDGVQVGLLRPSPATIRPRASMRTLVPFLPGVHLPQTYRVWTRFIYSAAMTGTSTSLL